MPSSCPPHLKQVRDSLTCRPRCLVCNEPKSHTMTEFTQFDPRKTTPENVWAIHVNHNRSLMTRRTEIMKRRITCKNCEGKKPNGKITPRYNTRLVV